jgi:hypothetical protein
MRSILAIGLLATTALIGANRADAAVVIVGSYGTLGADGVVTLPAGFLSYGYVTTDGGVPGGGQIAGVGGTDGSSYQSDVFSATPGEPVKFDFNYVTSDGAGYADYAWAELRTDLNVHVAWLFTGRTKSSGNIAPGFGLPGLDAVLTPPTSGIIGGAPTWSPLGSSSGTCYSSGCGYTGWIESAYTIGSSGNYTLDFGVTHYLDTAFQSGMAFAGATVGGRAIKTGSIEDTPEPASMLLLGIGLAGLACVRRWMMAKPG